MSLENPKDASKIQDMAEASEQDVDEAVACASTAFKKGPWAKFTGAQRAKCLNKLADLIDEHAAELALFESVCSGRPYTQIMHGDMPRVSGVYRCEWAVFSM